VKDVPHFKNWEDTTMTYENEKAQIPATKEKAEAEETNLQIQELEPRVAPNGGVGGSGFH
jgi:hypothetical protein